MSLHPKELTRESLRARRAQISGREIIANRRNPPDFHWHTLISHDACGRWRAAFESGDGGMGSRPLVNTTCSNWAEKLVAWRTAMHTLTKVFP